MNFGPYMGFPYYSIPRSSGGLFSKLFSNISFSGILNNTQKTFNIVNQAIPVIKQVKPVVSNAKTMFRVLNEFKKTDNTSEVIDNKVNTNDIKEGPTFFM